MKFKYLYDNRYSFQTSYPMSASVSIFSRSSPSPCSSSAKEMEKDISSDESLPDQMEGVSEASEGSESPGSSDNESGNSSSVDATEKIDELCALLRKEGPCDLGEVTKSMMSLAEDDINEEDHDGETVIDVAASAEQFDVLVWFKEKYVCDLKIKSKLLSQALCSCAGKGLAASCRKLLELGADVNFEQDDFDDYQDLTPLGFAILEGHEDAVEFLLTVQGINVNHVHRVSNARESLLHLATPYPSIVQKLLSAGADPYLKIESTEWNKGSGSAVHQAIYEARTSAKWEIMNPYLGWPHLRFNDYEENQDIINPFINTQLKHPNDKKLSDLIERLHSHPKMGSPLFTLTEAIQHDVRFTSEILHRRCGYIEGTFTTKENRLEEEGKVPIHRQIFGRTVAYNLVQKEQWGLALSILERYQADISDGTYFDSQKQVVTKESIVDLIVRLENQADVKASSEASFHFATGVLHFKAKGPTAPDLHFHFLTASKVFAKVTQPYLAKVIAKAALFKKSHFLTKCYSTPPDTLKPKERDGNIAKLITKLVYRARRKPWDDDSKCQLIRNIVEIYLPKFKGKDRGYYEAWIKQYESETHDYYGIDLSENSDEIEERHFSKQSPFIWHTLTQHFEMLIEKAEGDRFADWLNKFEQSPEDTDQEKIAKYFHQFERAPEPVQASPDVQRDLHTVNYFAAQGKLEEGLKSIKTKFMIAQIRGITYDTTLWSARARRNHRKLDEVEKPYFSAGVYDLAKVKMSVSLNDDMKITLLEKGNELKAKLLALRTERPTGKKSKKTAINYGNRANEIQELYSRKKSEFEKLLPRLNLGTLHNPFVSCGNTPFHALKYAYGIKPYQENKENRLRPRWNREGVAERPYSGKVYLSLHPLEDFGPNGPLDVPSLYFQGMINLPARILNERESTHPAYIPANRVVHTYIAKYPSFDKPYKSIYLYKYGLKKTVYESLRRLILKYAPHTPAQKAVKAMLGEYLCAYHEVRLQEKALELLKDIHPGSVLIYRSEIGGFTLTRPVYVFPNNPGKSEKHSLDHDAIKRRRTDRLAHNPHGS
ncbi:MAG: ankyrin repeat domain-containing protein [Parachlamydia sp.]|nr:ankyrin repeat domain-containing protein [Parachlamydia sp.]